MQEDPEFRLIRPAAPLPTESDFDPYGGNLDAQSAWKNFGTLSIQQAYNLFLTNPLSYQEDFMFMGSRAFEYYLPVIDRYLHEVSGNDENDDCLAAIIGGGVAAQFDWDDSDLSESAVSEIEELSAFVRVNVGRYSPSPTARRQIERSWQQVDARINAYRNRSEQGDGHVR